MTKPKGRHPHNALTATAIRNQSKPGKYADGQGLYLIVDKSGNKRWLLRITVLGRRRDIGLGGWPDVSLSVARKEALRMRQVARDGGNPIAERKKPHEQPPTFKDAAKQVHTEHKSSWKNAKHQTQWINTLKTYAFPHLGHLGVDEIGSGEVVSALLPIWLEKPETARRVRQRIGAVLDWAKAKGYRHQENPVSAVLRGLPKQRKAEKHHASLPYTDLPEFLKDLRNQNASRGALLAFEFLILTATRTSEVLLATWDEIDLDAKVWTIPAERMKANREFRIPLSDRAIELLTEARALTDGQAYVFEGKHPGKPFSQMVFLMLLRRMKLDITVHGFRSTFRDWAAERTNFPREICESALAHTIQNKTEAAYLRTDQFTKRTKLMASWATFATTPNRSAAVASIASTA